MSFLSHPMVFRDESRKKEVEAEHAQEPVRKQEPDLVVGQDLVSRANQIKHESVLPDVVGAEAVPARASREINHV